MSAYKISPEFNMILIRMNADVSIDDAYAFVTSIVNDTNYDPTYQIIVNNKTVEESDVAHKVCQSIELAASLIGGFFSKDKSTGVCYCRT